MTFTTRHNTRADRSSAKRHPAKQIPIGGGFRRQVAALLVERAQLQEEIRQLNATVQIYAEIVRRLESDDPRLYVA